MGRHQVGALGASSAIEVSRDVTGVEAVGVPGAVVRRRLPIVGCAPRPECQAHIEALPLAESHGAQGLLQKYLGVNYMKHALAVAPYPV